MSETRTRADTIRIVVVLCSAVVAVLGAFLGSGVFGAEPVQAASGGALAADATLLAPASTAFSIWSVIYTGLVGYAVWQALPAQHTSPRVRRTGAAMAASMLLNTGWLLAVILDQLWLSVPVILALLAVLVWLLLQLRRDRPGSIVETVLLDGTAHLYLGWVSVATAANTAALLLDLEVEPVWVGAQTWAVLALGALTVAGIALAFLGRGRLAVAASLCWGLAWIAMGRADPDGLVSAPVSIAAAVGAGVVAASTLAVRLRHDRRAGPVHPG